MVTNDYGDIVFQRGVLQFGTAGSSAATDVGYLASGEAITVTHSPNMVEARAEGYELPIIKKRSHTTLTISGTLLQHNTALLELIFGRSATGNKLTLSGEVADTPMFSCKLTATREDDETVVYDIIRAVSVGDFAPEYVSTDAAGLPFEFEAIESRDAELASSLTNGYNSTATLDTGVLTRTASQGYHLVAGQGGAADTLDSITGASLTDGETLMLQIADEDDAITLTHLDGTLELTGDVDWTMDSLDDWILLEYDSGDSAWVEKGRYDAVS
jgi:hypothetical protein